MPTCAEASCGRWRPERLAPRWASGIRLNGRWYCSRTCVHHAARAGLDGAVPSAPAILPLGPPRLGAEVKRLGHAKGDQVLRALAVQGNVSSLAWFDVARVTHGPAWRHARWDRFTWIRVEGTTQVSNVLVPGVMEGTCPAAHTAH